MTAREFVRAMKKALSAWSDDYAASMGAALSYYTLFSITPLLVIVMAIAGLLFGAEAVRGEIIAELSGFVGEEGARAVDELLANANKPTEGVVAALIGFGLLILAATTVLRELQSDLDRIWRVPVDADHRALPDFLRSRVLSVVMILAIAFVLIVSLVLSTAISVLGKWWGPLFRGWELVAHGVDLVLSFGMMTLLFALIYKIVPRARIEWHDVWVGAAMTAVLFSVGKILIGLYLGRSDVTSGFGAAGSLVLLMVWVYYSSQVFLIGAEFTWVYAHDHGSRRRAGARHATAP